MSPDSAQLSQGRAARRRERRRTTSTASVADEFCTDPRPQGRGWVVLTLNFEIHQKSSEICITYTTYHFVYNHLTLLTSV